MKKLFLLFALLCLSTFLSGTSDDNQQTILISILDNTVKNDKTHRSQDEIPIQACYYKDVSTLCVSFLWSIGEVGITITNLGGGELFDCEVDSRIGSIILPLSGADGEYRISFVTEVAEYEGVFTIE